MALHLELRPKTFSEILGETNRLTAKAVETVLKKKDPNRCFFFHGPAGCGKTTMARIIAREVGAVIADDDAYNRDFHELNAADFRGIDMVRDIRDKSMYAPIGGKAVVWLLDECHKLSPDAQEALLKSLEDTPAYNWFIFCTSEPQKMKKSLLRRCGQFQMAPLEEPEIKTMIKKVALKEGKKLSAKILKEVVKESMGSPGMALSILDTIIDMDEADMLSVISRIAEQQNAVIELCRALLKSAPFKKLLPILKKLEDTDPESTRRQVLEYFRKVGLGGNEFAYVVMSCFKDNYYDNGKAGLFMSVYEAVLVMEG